MVKQSKMNGYTLKVLDKARCRAVLEKHGYKKASNCSAFTKNIQVDVNDYIIQTVYINDEVVVCAEKCEIENDIDIDVVLEMIERKAVEISVYRKEEPYNGIMYSEVFVKSTYLVGDYYGVIVGVPNQTVNKYKKDFLVEFRGAKVPQWAKKDLFVISGKDAYNHTFGDMTEIYPKAWVSLNEIKEFIK